MRMNHVMLVGRLVKTPDLFVTEAGKKGSFITLAVGRPYKNQNGEYETDFLDCTLWTGIAETTAEYCKTGDVIGVTGKLQSRIVENEDGSKYKKMEVIADRVTFISSKPNKPDDDVVSNVEEEQNTVNTDSNYEEKKEEKDNKKTRKNK